MIYWYDFNLSVAVYVGFIALAGTAAETGVMVLDFIDIEIARLRKQKQAPLTAQEIKASVENATVQRVRPVAITAFIPCLACYPLCGQQVQELMSHNA